MYYCKRCRTWHKGGRIAKAHRAYGDPTRKPKGVKRSVKKIFRPVQMKPTKIQVKKMKQLEKATKQRVKRVKQESKDFGNLIKPKPITAMVKPKPVYKPTQRDISEPRSMKLKRELGALGKLELMRKKMRSYAGHTEKEQELYRQKSFRKLTDKEQIDMILAGRRKKSAYESLKKYKQALRTEPGFDIVEFEKYGGSDDWMYEMRYGGEFVKAKKQFSTGTRILI